jgi:hypothetical protein
VGSMNSRILSLKTFLAWFIVRIVRWLFLVQDITMSCRISNYRRLN